MSAAQPQIHSGRWKRRKQFSQRAGKTDTIKSKVNLSNVVTCWVTLKTFMRIQHNPQQIFLEDLWINPHQHKHGMALQWCLPCAAGVTEDPKRAPTTFPSNSCFSQQMFHPDAWLCFGQHLEQQKELEDERIHWGVHSLELE